MRPNFQTMLSACAVYALIGCAEPAFVAEDYLYLEDRYAVTIRRDIRGVPHVLGETNADAAFGFAYAQAEDNWQLIEEAWMRTMNGISALICGSILKPMRMG